MAKFTRHELTLLASYLAGTASKTDKAQIKRWIDDVPDRRRFIAMLNASRIDYSLPMAHTVNNLPVHIVSISAGLTKAIRAEHSRRHKETPFSHRRIVGWPSLRQSLSSAVWAVAATLLIIAGWTISGINRAPVITPTISTYSTNNGERATVTLADGSTILLNVGTQVEVPSDYGAGNRTITLHGQAYFTVAPDAKAPFIVRSGSSITRVLGTRFVVRNYNGDSATTVTVQDGKVAVGSTIVAANQHVTVTSAGVSAVEQAPSSEMDFVRGVLTLRNRSLPSAIPELNRWYNVDIRLGDQLLDTREVDGGFVVGSVSDLQSILELMYDVRVVRNNRVLTLYPRG